MRSPARPRPDGSTPRRSTRGPSDATSTSPTSPRPTCSGGRRGRTGSRTSCSGRRRTPSWSSPTSSGRTSTGWRCGRRSRSTRSAIAASARPERRTRSAVGLRPPRGAEAAGGGEHLIGHVDVVDEPGATRAVPVLVVAQAAYLADCERGEPAERPGDRTRGVVHAVATDHRDERREAHYLQPEPEQSLVVVEGG